MELIKFEKFCPEKKKKAADLNTVFMYDNKEHCRHSCRPFVECPVFKIKPFEYYDDEDE